MEFKSKSEIIDKLYAYRTKMTNNNILYTNYLLQSIIHDNYHKALHSYPDQRVFDFLVLNTLSVEQLVNVLYICESEYKIQVEILECLEFEHVAFVKWDTSVENLEF